MKIKSLLATSFLVAVSACSDNSGFDYSNSEDTFTKAVVTTALASQQGDVDKNAYLELSLKCEYKSGEEPDLANAMLSALVVDEDAQPYELTNMSIKINNHAIIESDVLKQLDLSKYENERLVTYADIYMSSVNEGPTSVAEINNILLPLEEINKSGGDPVSGLSEEQGSLLAQVKSVLEQFSNGYLDTKTISVRYETTNGQVNTSVFSLEDENFKKVMAECGWEKFGSEYAKVVGKEKAEAAAAAVVATAAENGDANAQYDLGSRYKNGQGVLRNDVKAYRLYEKAAEQGSADGQYTVGKLHIEGFYVPELTDIPPSEIEEGARLIRLAAAQGHALARECVQKGFAGC